MLIPLDKSWVKPEDLIDATDNLLVIIDGKLVTQLVSIDFENQRIVYLDEAMQEKHLSGEFGVFFDKTRAKGLILNASHHFSEADYKNQPPCGLPEGFIVHINGHPCTLLKETTVATTMPMEEILTTIATAPNTAKMDRE
ncbi:MAG: hypothetical protein K8F30_12610 [Taibaiella sp.]|nr:hypothetical protein [Taibaiella sp.]